MPDPYIEHQLLLPQSKAIIYGKYKALKSMLALDLAFSLSTGNNWLGLHTRKCRVLSIQSEIDVALYERRVQKYWRGMNGLSIPQKPDLWFLSDYAIRLDQKFGLDLLRRYVNEVKPEVLILDPLYIMVGGNMLDPETAAAAASNLNALIRDCDLAVVIVAHARKRTLDEDAWGTDDLLGTAVWSYWPDTVIRIKYGGGDKLVLNFDVTRHAEEAVPEIAAEFCRPTLQWKVTEPKPPIGGK